MSPVENQRRNSVCVWGQVGSKPMLNKGSGGASHDPSAKSNTVRTPRAHHNVVVAYTSWQFVERDMENAKCYFELAAIGGDAKSRHNLGMFERNASNMSRAVKHWMISVAAGCDKSLSEIRDCFTNGHVTKDDFDKALRAHKEAKDEKMSAHREAYLSKILSNH